MKSTWQIKRLGEICEIKTGKKDVNQGNPNGEYPFFTCARKHTYSDSYSFDTEALLIAGNGDVGHVSYYKGKFEAYQRTYVLLKFNGILPQFLFLFLNGYLKETISKQKLGNTMPYIKMGMLAEFKVIIPPISEQKRIVKILDESLEKLDNVKNSTELNLVNSKYFFDSYLQDVFSNPKQNWESKKIGEVCNLMTGGTPSRAKKEYFLGGEIKWLVSGDVNKGEIFDCEGRITELGMNSSNTKYLPVNSVVIALNGQGKTRGMVSMLHVKATCNQSVVSIYPKDLDLIIPEYVYFNLKVRYQEIRKMTGDDGNDRRGLNMPLIRNIKINFPKSVAEQKKLVVRFQSLLEKTRRLEEVYKKKLQNIEELKKSILQKAFNGEL